MKDSNLPTRTRGKGGAERISRRSSALQDLTDRSKVVLSSNEVLPTWISSAYS